MENSIAEELKKTLLEKDLNRLLSISEAAKLIGVSSTTIRRFCNSGRLQAYRLANSKHRRIRKLDVLSLLEKE